MSGQKGSHGVNTAPPGRKNPLTGTRRATMDGQQEVLYQDGTDFYSQLQTQNTEHQTPGNTGRSGLFDLFQQPAELVSIEAYRT